MSKRRRFSGELKAKIALEALRGDRTLQEIASKHPVHPNQVSAWKRQAIAGLGEVFSNGGERRRRDHESEVRRAAREDRRVDGGAGFFVERVRSMSRAERRALVRRAHPELSVSRQCRLLSVGRSSLYYTTRGESEERPGAVAGMARQLMDEHGAHGLDSRVRRGQETPWRLSFPTPRDPNQPHPCPGGRRGANSGHRAARDRTRDRGTRGWPWTAVEGNSTANRGNTKSEDL